MKPISGITIDRKQTGRMATPSGLPRAAKRVGRLMLALGTVGLFSEVSLSAGPAPAAPGSAAVPAATASLDDTRVTLGKWIETQQIISKERKEWQQGKEILTGRLELVKKEIASLQESIKKTEAEVADARKKQDELQAENDKLMAVGTQLAQAATALEAEVRRLYKTMPEPIRTGVQPLYQRIPEDPATTKISAAERFQNVLGILNEFNKANNEIIVKYEVHNLADGKPAEVQAIYVGIAQAYFVSAGGEAGIGRPGADGWTWETSKAAARDITTALEILQGKQSPAFVPLPVKLQ